MYVYDYTVCVYGYACIYLVNVYILLMFAYNGNLYGKLHK